MEHVRDIRARLAVVGGGTAGMAAAIIGARLGLETVVIEKENEVGGVPIQALMGSFANLFVNLEGKPLVASLPLEILQRLIDAGDMIYDSCEQAVHGKIGQPFTIPYQPETYVGVIREIARQAGVRILRGTQVLHPSVRSGCVTEAVCQSPRGCFVCRADVWIDATGDASFAASAGVPCTVQSDSSFGQLMRIRGVRIEDYLDWLYETRPWLPDKEFIGWLSGYLNLSEEQLHSSKLWRKLMDPIYYGHAPMLSPDDITFTPRKLDYLRRRWQEEGLIYTAEMCWLRRPLMRAVQNGDFSLDRPIEGGGRITFNNDGFAYGAWGAGVALCNVAQPYQLDACDPVQAQRAQKAATAYNREAFEFFRRYVPGFEHAELQDIAPRAVSRFPRMICGIKTVRPQDVFGTVPMIPDAVYLFGGGNSFKSGFGIPYGMLVPQTLSNVLAAGKCASGARYCRSQVSCMSMGVAAAAAAKLMTEERCGAQNVSIAALQDLLTQKLDVLL